MAESIRRLPDAELAVMQALWKCTPPVDRADIHRHLEEAEHPMAPTTLLTVLSRLGEKGFLQTEKTGRTTRYVPLIAEKDYVSAQGKRFFRQLCGGSVSAFAAALCDSGLTKEELTELRALLERGEL